jgi:seryl-tRNA synthetase
MLDLKTIRPDPAPVRAALARRGDGSDERLDRALALDERWRVLETEVGELRARRNAGAAEIGRAKRAGGTRRRRSPPCRSSRRG